MRTCPDVYDHGAARIYAALRERLDCNGIENRLCRLLIDVNRYRDQDTLIPLVCAVFVWNMEKPTLPDRAGG